jgi:hypothetical protein
LGINQRSELRHIGLVARGRMDIGLIGHRRRLPAGAAVLVIELRIDEATTAE